MSAIETPTGDELLKVLAALGNPHRMRIVAALAGNRNYVSRLAREIGMSRPLLHMHLQRLEAAGLVVGSLELSETGKAMKFFEVAPFFYELTPGAIATAAATLSDQQDPAAGGTARTTTETGAPTATEQHAPTAAEQPEQKEGAQ
ncbi:ArsR/SmtB family transcription factor [Streptomyces iconiensis]|uniref:Winged helix-turn-helix domain-containing protein n=1 Tax=Streptomyces iconiensis TaxID=1384038 RepID=A0ABT7A9L7_9ACTN|nr:winged helix-turn-helix domain-containing protein [Streptomyces iconiensis]MDJ1138046.1 winged helix-turn-helix domain-containing protein [Streptomyces iconiensis]